MSGEGPFPGRPRDGEGTGAAALDRERAGLCASCRQARVQRNRRGSAFWRCGRADHDSGFPRYPPLPVRACPGHEPL